MNAPIPLAIQLERASHAVARRKHMAKREEWLMYELDKLYDDEESPRKLTAPCGCVSVKETEDGFVSRRWIDCEEAE